MKTCLNVKIKSDSEFTILLEAIVDELLRADVHYIISKGLATSGKEHSSAINFSPVFWSFTYRAHIESVFYHLCKIYDQHNSGFHLRRFIELVQDNPTMFSIENARRRLGKNVEDEMKLYKSLDEELLKKDYCFVTEENPIFLNLNKWRDFVFAHRNPKQILSQKPFEVDYPFPFSEIELLLEKGSEIVNRYSGYFSSTHYSRATDSNGWDDFSYVLESIDHHPRFVEYKAWDAVYKKT